MTGLSSLTLNTIERTSYINISFDEGVNAMLFDYGMRTDVFGDYPIAYHFFGKGQVQKVTCLSDAVALGITEGGVMGGVPYYHIERYYSFIGQDKPLYVMFADCLRMVGHTMKPDFSAMADIQLMAKGEVYQMGVWTEQQVWKRSDDGGYAFTELLGNIQSCAEMFSGHTGITRDSASAASVILFANTASLYGDSSNTLKVDYKKLPYALSLNFPKVSLVLGQNGTDKVHSMQRGNVNKCPVGLMGAVLGCLTLASAEESIGSLQTMDLNKNDDFNDVELGFGSISADGSSDDFGRIDGINDVRRNVIAQNGYIFPTAYRPKEASYFLCNDQTLSTGDYGSIANNRVIHKCQRIIRSIMLPYVESNIDIDLTTGKMSAADATILQNEITQALGNNLVNQRGQQQTNGCYIDINTDVNILLTDSVEIDVSLFPADSSPVINFMEQYKIVE